MNCARRKKRNAAELPSGPRTLSKVRRETTKGDGFAAIVHPQTRNDMKKEPILATFPAASGVSEISNIPTTSTGEPS